MAAARASASQVAAAWKNGLELLATNKGDDAQSLGAELQSSGREHGVKLTEAAGALLVAIAKLRKAAGQPCGDLIEALRGLKATWSETSVLLQCNGGGGITGPWAQAADLAKNVVGKATGETANALTAAMALTKDIGITWTPKLTQTTAAEVSSLQVDDESALQAAASAPQSISGTGADHAAALLRAALAQLRMETPQVMDALKDAKEALSAFRDLNVPESEGTALLAVSLANRSVDPFSSLQAANHALKTFSEIGHSKGQAAALHAIACAFNCKQNTDDCIFRAGEALKLTQQLGDRIHESQILRTLVEAHLVFGAGEKALSLARDALAVAKGLGAKPMEADALCLVAKAQTACEDGKLAAVKNAKEALTLYQELGLRSKEKEVITILADVNTGEALKCAQGLADKFRQDGDKEEEAACKYAIAAMKLCEKDLDQALRSASESASGCKDAGDRTGQAKALWLQAEVHLSKEEPGEAMRLASQACTLYRNQPFPTEASRAGELACVQQQVTANIMLGAIDEAFRFAVGEGKRFKSLRDRRGEGCVLMMLVRLHLFRLEKDPALKVLNFIPPLFSVTGDRINEGDAWETMARIHLSNGNVSEAQKAAQECTNTYRKQGSMRGRALAAILLAEVQFALAINGKGNAVEALDATKEASALCREQGNKEQLALCLHMRANANLMLGNADEGVQDAEEALEIYGELRNFSGEAGALLMQAGAYLAKSEFEESKRCATEAKNKFKDEADQAGVANANDFMSEVAKFESGELHLSQFRGFGIKRGDPFAAMAAQREQQKAAATARQTKAKLTMMSDIWVFQADASQKNSQVCMTHFDGFEVRSGVGQTEEEKKAAAKAQKQPNHEAFSKDFKETVQQHGYPEKDAVVFSVRWVQATEEPKVPRGRSKGRAREAGDFRREDDVRVVSHGQLGAPNQDVSRYGKSSRLEPDGERHGYIRR